MLRQQAVPVVKPPQLYPPWNEQKRKGHQLNKEEATLKAEFQAKKETLALEIEIAQASAEIDCLKLPKREMIFKSMFKDMTQHKGMFMIMTMMMMMRDF